MVRKTNFLWKHKTGKLKGKLTAKAKAHLSTKITEYYERIKILKPKRIRRQVAFNAESAGVNIGISLRAVTINTDITEEELKNALNEIIGSEENLQSLPFFTMGFEEELIDEFEDKGLEEGVIHVELNIRGKQTLFRL